jgi:hypothetical protein
MFMQAGGQIVVVKAILQPWSLMTLPVIVAPWKTASEADLQTLSPVLHRPVSGC